ncbi:Hydroxyacid-oxoacid transhydrogenase, partial [Nibea albiflora]
GVGVQTVQKTDYAFEMASSNIRYGAGVSREIGMDLQNLGAQNVCLMTDRNLSVLPPVKAVLESLAKNGIQYKVYDNVRVEPTDTSFKEAIAFAKNGSFDVYVAVGGASVIDTCKAANLYASHPDPRLPGLCQRSNRQREASDRSLPTTAGTGSETTGVAIFDFESLKAKTGIASRAIRPTLGIVDPIHTLSMPERVAANSGFDVLCHGMSYPIAGNVKSHSAKGYSVEHPLVPHGLSVVLTSPAVFNFTAPSCPERHLEAAEILVPVYPVYLSSGAVTDSVLRSGTVTDSVLRSGADIRQVKREDAGAVLADTLRHFLFDLAVEDGLWRRASNQTVTHDNTSEDDLSELFEASMKIY